MEQLSTANINLSTAITYEEYFEDFKKKSEVTDLSSLTDDEKEKHPNVKLNFQRSSRINKTYKVNESLKKLVEEIDEPQLWLLITESWCGDSAQNVPYIVEIARLNALIDTKIILRDKNPDVMDLYLTNGTRSIPKLIVFDKNGNELFQWGPRPKDARELVTRLKGEGKTKQEFLEQLHLWYGRNRGKVLEEEITGLLKGL